MTTIRALAEDNAWWSHQPGLDKSQAKKKKELKIKLNRYLVTDRIDFIIYLTELIELIRSIEYHSTEWLDLIEHHLISKRARVVCFLMTFHVPS